MIAAIYARKSTEQTGLADEQKSVARQLEHARAYAAAKGWTVPHEYEYVDDGISGAEFDTRPGFLRLMNALKPKAPFQMLIMSEVSRLGREQIETAYALKQLSVAGVRCFSYLDGRELLMESATDKFLMGAVTFAADLEREKAKQRTYDAMIRKAKAGHVTGGRRFGYDNVDVLDATGKRSHVEYRINPTEADVVRRMFQLKAEGTGHSRIAKQLNAERAVTPRSQQGRPKGWAPSSVRGVLLNELYRGVITWNKSKKRNAWGQKQQTDRPMGEWLQVQAPQLRIVSEDLWGAAHERLGKGRTKYDRDTHGQRRNRKDEDSKYLLPSFGRCAVCGGGLSVRSRSHGDNQRKFFYACTAHYNKGPEVCAHADLWEMEELDHELMATIGERLKSATDALITEARQQFEAAAPAVVDVEARRRRELAALDREQARLTDAVAAGGDMPILIARLRDTERRRVELMADTPAPNRPQASWQEIERRMRERLTDFRSLLTGGTIAQARQFLRLLPEPIKFTPYVDRGYRAIKFQGRLALDAFFGGELVTFVVSPRGSAKDYRPIFDGHMRSDRRAA